MLYTPEEYDNMDSFKKAAIETQDFSDRILSSVEIFSKLSTPKLSSGEVVSKDSRLIGNFLTT